MNTDKLDKLDILLYYPVKNESDADLEYFDSIDDSDIVLSDKLTARCMRTIRREQRKPFVEAVKRISSRVAISVLVILAAGFVTIMSVEALRNAVWNAVTEWYEEYIALYYSPSEDSETQDDTAISEDSGADSETKENVSVLEAIETVYKPTYFPEAVEEEIVFNNLHTVYIDYYVGNDWRGSYKQMLLADIEKRVDEQGTLIKECYIHGNTAKIFQPENKELLSIIWTDNQYIYWIISAYDLDTVIQIAEGVKSISDTQ